MVMFRALKAEEIEIRVGRKTSAGVVFLLYKNARTDADILDEAVGPMGWQKSYSRDNANCTVSIWDAEKSQWVSKEDTGTKSNTEAEKGMASDSFKRACVMWGIGRELYTAPLIYVKSDRLEFDKSGNPKGDIYVKSITISEDKKITGLVVGYKVNGKTSEIFSYGKGSSTQTTSQPKAASSTPKVVATTSTSETSATDENVDTKVTLSKDDCDPETVVYSGGYHKGKTVAQTAKSEGGINTLKWYANRSLGKNEDMNKQILASQKYLEDHPELTTA